MARRAAASVHQHSKVEVIELILFVAFVALLVWVCHEDPL